MLHLQSEMRQPESTLGRGVLTSLAVSVTEPTVLSGDLAAYVCSDGSLGLTELECMRIQSPSQDAKATESSAKSSSSNSRMSWLFTAVVSLGFSFILLTQN